MFGLINGACLPILAKGLLQRRELIKDIVLRLAHGPSRTKRRRRTTEQGTSTSDQRRKETGKWRNRSGWLRPQQRPAQRQRCLLRLEELNALRHAQRHPLRCSCAVVYRRFENLMAVLEHRPERIQVEARRPPSVQHRHEIAIRHDTKSRRHESANCRPALRRVDQGYEIRSEEHTSELQSL